MTEVKETKAVRNRFPDRFTVDPENLEKLGKLLEQLRCSVQGCNATRKEILNWIIGKFPVELSASDLKELSEKFYDEERFLRLALEEVRAAKARGERRTIEEILTRKSQAVAPARKPRKRKPTHPADDEPASFVTEVAVSANQS